MIITQDFLSFSFSCVSESWEGFRSNYSFFCVCVFVVQFLPIALHFELLLSKTSERGFAIWKFLTLVLPLIKRKNLMHFLFCFWSESSRTEHPLAGCISNIYPLHLSFVVTFSPSFSHFLLEMNTFKMLDTASISVCYHWQKYSRSAAGGIVLSWRRI